MVCTFETKSTKPFHDGHVGLATISGTDFSFSDEKHDEMLNLVPFPDVIFFEL